MTNATTAAPAFIRSRALGSIRVVPMACSIGAEVANGMAIWDNRCTQHYAVQDFWPAVRNLERAGIIGDKPC